MKKFKVLDNNKGISILELVVVVAIMAIIGVTMFLATSVATDRHVTSCANKICMSFEQTRGLTLGKQSGTIKFWLNSNNEICAQMYINGSEYGDEVAIGHAGLSVSFVFVNPSNPSSQTTRALSSGGCEIEFSRSTGGVTQIIFDGSVETQKLKSIIVTNGHREMTIDVDTYTGRINVNT